MRENRPGPQVQDVDREQSTERRARIARALLRKRQIVDELLGGRICANPNWDMLLELYLAGLAEQSVYQSYLVADAPPANVHRRSARLEAKGYVSRTTDVRDHRRVIVELRPETRAALDHHRGRVQCRDHGDGR